MRHRINTIIGVVAANGSVVRIKIEAVLGLWRKGGSWPWLIEIYLKATDHDAADKVLQLGAGFDKPKNHECFSY
jgi:hypothetical protein